LSYRNEMGERGSDQTSPGQGQGQVADVVNAVENARFQASAAM